MDYDEVANVSSGATTPITPSESTEYIAHEIVFAIFAIIAIIADSLIIYTTLYFKRMRIAPYMFLASWAAADLLSLLLLPSGLRIISTIEKISVPYELYCAFTQSGSMFHVATILFVILVAIDWLIAAYFPRASERFRKWYKLVLGVLWSLVFILVFFSVYYCWVSWMHFVIPFVSVILVLGTFFLVIFVIQIVRLVQKIRKRSSEHSGLAINLATAFLGCWTLAFLNATFIFHISFHPMIVIVSFCLIYSSSIVNFGLLYRFNNDFAACVRQVLSCKRVKYQEDLTEDISIQNNVNSNSVSINFRNPALMPNLAHTIRA